MRIIGVISLAAIVVLSRWPAGAQIYDTNNVVVQTFAGSGFSGYLDGQGTQTMFNNPNAVVADSHGNLFVWDSLNWRIRKIAPDSTVTTFAGGGSQGTGVGTNVNLSGSSVMTIDQNDTIWMVASSLCKITSGAAVTYITLPPLEQAGGLCADSLGNVYISDFNPVHGNRIYRYDTNSNWSVFAGSGNAGYADGNGIFTAFYEPKALAADAANNIFVWDSFNGFIRKIDQNQNVTTFAGKYGAYGTKADGVGTNAVFFSIYAMCFDALGNLIVFDDACIREISPTANTVTLAGSFTQNGFANGAGNFALFSLPGSNGGSANGVCVSQGMVFAADSANQRIRNIAYNPTPVVHRQPQPQISCLGQSASFQVTAVGMQPLYYQWLLNSVPLAGQTSTNLVLANLVASQAGAYSVIVSNSFNAATSAPAQLVINDACVGVQLYAGLNMSGQPGATYLLSYTTNLNAPINWLPLATNTMPVSGWLYIDTNTPFSPQRFYRAQLSP